MTAGSSVPEAARAAAIDAFFGPNPDLPRRSVLAMQVALDAAAPFIVAAAVAEERATTGRRLAELEKALRSFADHGLNCDLTPTINCATVKTTYEHFRSYLVRLDDHVRDAVRAALASPGEET